MRVFALPEKTLDTARALLDALREPHQAHQEHIRRPWSLGGHHWFSAFSLSYDRCGFSHGGRASLNSLLSRNAIMMLCSTMKRYSKSPATIACRFD